MPLNVARTYTVYCRHIRVQTRIRTPQPPDFNFSRGTHNLGPFTTQYLIGVIIKLEDNKIEFAKGPFTL